MTLNAKQQLFVTEYLVDKNATRAAIAAGYSENGARGQGSRLLANAHIKEAIEKGLTEQQNKIHKRMAARNITKERWLAELAAIATANMDDYAEVVEEVSYIKQDDEGKDQQVMRTYTRIIPTKSRHRSFGKAIKKINETKNGIGIELHSKQTALDTLGKHYGWLKEHVELTGKDGGPQVILTMPDNGRSATAAVVVEQLTPPASAPDKPEEPK